MRNQLSGFTSWLLIVAASASIATTAAPGNKPVVLGADSATLEWGPCPAFMPASCRIAVLNGNPAEANSDVLFKLASKTTAPSHWHSSAERMVLISGEMRVEYEGRPAARIRAGDYAYGPPGLAHAAHCVSDVDCMLFIAFENPVDAFETP